MQIGAADPREKDPDQDVIDARFRARHVLQLQPGFSPAFHQRAHGPLVEVADDLEDHLAVVSRHQAVEHLGESGRKLGVDHAAADRDDLPDILTLSHPHTIRLDLEPGVYVEPSVRAARG